MLGDVRWDLSGSLLHMTTGDRWYMREPETVRGMRLTVRRFGVEPGCQPTANEHRLEAYELENSRWLTVEALVANRLDRGYFISVEQIANGVRTRRHFPAQPGYPAFDLIEEETLS